MTRLHGVALAAILLAGCRGLLPGPTGGAATREPAGYRAKTPQGVDLVFDARLGLYAVPEASGVYWLDQRYYRKSGTGWQSSPGLSGPWRECASADLPAGLR